MLSISPRGLIEAPLILAFFVVSGLRATFNLPYELGANWMFQITSGSEATEYLKATRKWVFLRGVLPMFAIFAPIDFMFFDSSKAVFHLAFGLAIVAVLTEFFFFHFNKVPFTCSYLPAKSHLAFQAGAYLYGFSIYTFTISSLELWVGASPLRTAGFFSIVVGTLAGVSAYRRQTKSGAPGIIYEDETDPVVRQLNLT